MALADFEFYPSVKTWSPIDIDSGNVLSNGNLTVTRGPAQVYSGIRSYMRKSAGKYYWEILFTSGDVQDVWLGIANIAYNIDTALGADNHNSFGAILSNGVAYFAGGVIGNFSSSTFSPGDVCCLALDLTNSKLWLRRNNTSWNNTSDDPATNTGGYDISSIATPIFAAAALYGDNGATDVITANFGGTSYAYTPPSGFNNL